MRVQTKIICTIGPAVNSVEKIIELIAAGMNVARLNFSHNTHEEHENTIHFLKQARKIAHVPLAILLDTKGPEIRIGVLKHKMEVHSGQRISLVETAQEGKNQIPIHPFSVFDTVSVGMKVLFDDGYISSEIVQKKNNEIVVEINNPGVLHSQKGVNIPQAYLNLPAMTEKDEEDIKFGISHGVDIIAASFIRSSQQVLSMKRFLNEQHSDIPIIAKIENKEGVENFDEILQVADGIMVARGDLGVEVDISKVPILQKMMIQKSYERYKPVVIATQMLESMINNPRPTRAEVSDIANAIYDSTSLVMLSAETATGNYPIETVRQMKSVIKEAEDNFDYHELFVRQCHSPSIQKCDVSSTVAIAAVEAVYSAKAKAIFVITSSGFTARLISRLRPNVPIIAFTNSEKIYHRLSFIWGVVPIYSQECNDADEALKLMSEFALEKKIVSFGDLIVFIAGMPFGRKGSTNMLRIESIGSIIVRGYKGYGKKVEGEVVLATSSDLVKQETVKQKIIVIPISNEKFIPLMKEALGVILDNSSGDIISENHAIEIAKKYDIPILVGVDNAMTLLSEGDIVVLNPKKALVYRPKKR